MRPSSTYPFAVRSDQRRCGTGRARRNVADPPVPEIGDELACSRALVDLGHRLLDATVSDLEAAVGTKVDLNA